MKKAHKDTGIYLKSSKFHAQLYEVKPNGKLMFSFGNSSWLPSSFKTIQELKASVKHNQRSFLKGFKRTVVKLV